MFANFYECKRVLVTGDTGFKGSWLCEWLLGLGAEVLGLGLPPETEPSLFNQLNLDRRIQHHPLDIRDKATVRDLVVRLQPDIVFHLAAQPLVRLSYEIPVETYEVNVMGSVHMLDALRFVGKRCAAVFITTDKCYSNREWLHAYREEDPIGGHDPYSSSKGACELAIDSFRNSYFSDPLTTGMALASARAGNVIGGGDWALDRIVPDCIRALQRDEPIQVRNPHATRPWQHVLEPIAGYLRLARHLYEGMDSDGTIQAPLDAICSAFNFGPSLQSNRTVGNLVDEVTKHWPGGEWIDVSDHGHQVHEASLLNLSSDKAFHLLHWSPRWDFHRTVQATVEWYQAAMSPTFDAQEFTASQIQDYTAPS